MGDTRADTELGCLLGSVVLLLGVHAVDAVRQLRFREPLGWHGICPLQPVGEGGESGWRGLPRPLGSPSRCLFPGHAGCSWSGPLCTTRSPPMAPRWSPHCSKCALLSNTHLNRRNNRCRHNCLQTLDLSLLFKFKVLVVKRKKSKRLKILSPSAFVCSPSLCGVRDQQEGHTVQAAFPLPWRTGPSACGTHTGLSCHPLV